MSRIDELIAELAPRGVEVKALGEVGEFIRGNGLQKADLRDVGFPAVHYGQIHTHYGVWATETKSFTDENIAVKLRRARRGDLLIATTSEDDDAVAKATAWLGNTDVALSGDAYIYRHELEPKYVSYFFHSTSFQDQKRRFISGTKVRRISGDALAKIRIPVPPLEVQREIVRVLDQFTQLEAELEAELEARRRQYEHYQREVFDRLDSVGVRRVAVKELGRWYGGGTPSKSRSDYWVDGTIPWISPKDMGRSVVTDTEDHITEAAVRNSATKLVPANAVALVARSSILDHTLPIAFVPSPSALNQDMKAVIAADGIEPRYVFHVLRANRARMLRSVRRTGGSVASLDSQKLWKFDVPVPAADEQLRIIEFMDRFDALVNDLSIGLPAELAARRKQYEYYRDKLLTFEEAVA
ncbi:restriction endonuclease subunit S [Auritidibacter ignavus]|uniref:restriction endonuclease subunit S n=1 Tax=Auritidibacter ignavus TaxID=678932 RepID=UPI00109D5AC8|nr:restriction endonuclease subunit S [Auritidibacter ignavus]